MAKKNKVKSQSGQPGAAKRPTISLAMMVKNEEEMLPRALASAAPWVDEIIVVDTGSTDRTVEIAESYGAKIYYHPWEHSFSVHRNQSIGYCTGDWILIMDADEELDQETAPQILELAKDTTVNCFLFKLYNDIKGGGSTFLMHARLFRAGVGFHYEGLVHNVPTIPGAYAPSEVKLYHYGYNLDKEAMDAKHQRRLDMLAKAIDGDPQNYKLHAYLAQSLASKEESREQAIKESLEAIRLANEQKAPSVDFPRCYYPLIGSLFFLQRWDEVIQHCNDCLQKMPHYPDPYIFLMNAYSSREDWDRVLEYAPKFFEMQSMVESRQTDFLFVENQTNNMFPQGYHLWCMAATKLGRFDEALQAYEKLVNEERGEAESLAVIKKVLREKEKAADLALQLCELVQGVRPEWAWVNELLPLARQMSADQEFKELRAQGMQALENGDHAGAIEKLEKCVEFFIEDADIQLSLAKAYYALNQPEQTKKNLLMGLNAHPGHIWGWKAMIDLAAAENNTNAAKHYLERLLLISPGDQQVRQLYEQVKEAVAEEADKTVAQSAPELVVFLVGGLSLKPIRKIAPHFLMHRAWGEMLFENTDPANSMGRWAAVYTGDEAAAAAFDGREQNFAEPLGLSELGGTDVWSQIARHKRVGLLSVPLGHPAPQINGWAVAGYPGGLLSEDMVFPRELVPKVLTSGYRSDFVANQREQQLLSALLSSGVLHLGRMMQIERNRMKLAADMPAVDVLAVGFSCLDWAQQCFGLNDPRSFALYQQVYTIIETTLAALQPKHFAVLGQSGYDEMTLSPTGNGFYCLSWLMGENAKAPAADIAPEIMRLLGA